MVESLLDGARRHRLALLKASVTTAARPFALRSLPTCRRLFGINAVNPSAIISTHAPTTLTLPGFRVVIASSVVIAAPQTESAFQERLSDRAAADAVLPSITLASTFFAQARWLRRVTSRPALARCETPCVSSRPLSPPRPRSLRCLLYPVDRCARCSCPWSSS